MLADRRISSPIPNFTTKFVSRLNQPALFSSTVTTHHAGKDTLQEVEKCICHRRQGLTKHAAGGKLVAFQWHFCIYGKWLQFFHPPRILGWYCCSCNLRNESHIEIGDASGGKNSSWQSCRSTSPWCAVVPCHHWTDIALTKIAGHDEGGGPWFESIDRWPHHRNALAAFGSSLANL